MCSQPLYQHCMISQLKCQCRKEQGGGRRAGWEEGTFQMEFAAKTWCYIHMHSTSK